MERDEMDEKKSYPDEGTEFYQDGFGERINSGDDSEPEMPMDTESTDADIETGKVFRERLDEVDLGTGEAEEIDILEADMNDEGTPNPAGQDADRSM